MHIFNIRFCAVFILLACNGGPTTTGDAKAVRGVAVQRNVTEHGVVEQPRDLSAASFGSAARPGVGTSDGSYEVPSSAWIEMKLKGERIFLARSARSPDLTIYRFGRGDVQFPTSQTSVMFDISGLGAWQGGDSLQIVSPNAGMTMAGPENVLSAYPSAGSTTITGQSFDWKANLAPIIDAARGDTTWVTQMVASRTADARTYYTTLGRAGIARGFTVSDGRPAVLSAALAPVAQDRHLALHWKGSQFAALASQAGPGAEAAPTPALAVRALPDPLARNNNLFSRYYVGLPTLVELGPIAGAADLDQDLDYGDPFSSASAAWTEFVTLVYAMPVPVATPQGNGSLSAMIVAAIPVSSLAGTTAITPPLSPVRNAKIDGQSLDAPRIGVGTSPTLTWDAPAIGATTSYTVTVHAVEASSLGVTVNKIATLYTTSPSLKLPDSVMAPASSYVLTITAIAANGADPSRPFVGSLPYASADYVTARITP